MTRLSLPSLLLGSTILAACPGGVTPPDEDRPPKAEGFRWPDLQPPRSDGPARDVVVTHDTVRTLEARPRDVRPPQGTSCTSSGLAFDSDKPPSAGASLTLTVANGPATYTWVMGGITAGSVASWKGNAQVADLGGGKRSWTFTAISVPGSTGPWSFCFRKDATDDDWTKGSVVGCCVP
jgi:hypothetical protein